GPRGSRTAWPLGARGASRSGATWSPGPLGSARRDPLRNPHGQRQLRVPRPGADGAPGPAWWGDPRVQMGRLTLTRRPKYRTPLRAGQGSSARGVNQPAIASLPAVFL